MSRFSKTWLSKVDCPWPGVYAPAHAETPRGKLVFEPCGCWHVGNSGCYALDGSANISLGPACTHQPKPRSQSVSYVLNHVAVGMLEIRDVTISLEPACTHQPKPRHQGVSHLLNHVAVGMLEIRDVTRWMVQPTYL